MSGRDLSPHLEAAISAWRPHGVSDAAGAFARCVVWRSAPQNVERARALLFAASRLAAFGEGVGLELDADEALLSEASIERFIACGTQCCSPATRRTLRTNLRSLARALEHYPEPLPVALGRERAKAPYTPAVRSTGTCASRPASPPRPGGCALRR